MRIGNKGSMIDYFWLLICFTVFAITIIVAYYVWDNIYQPLSAMFGAGEATTVLTSVKSGFAIMDYIFMFLYFIMAAVPILFAILVKNNPIFLVLNIILLLVYFLIVPSLSNVVQSFWSMPQFTQYAAGGGGSLTFPAMMRVMQYLPLISAGLSIILMIAIASKTEGGLE